MSVVHRHCCSSLDSVKLIVLVHSRLRLTLTSVEGSVPFVISQTIMTTPERQQFGQLHTGLGWDLRGRDAYTNATSDASCYAITPMDLRPENHVMCHDCAFDKLGAFLADLDRRH